MEDTKGLADLAVIREQNKMYGLGGSADAGGDSETHSQTPEFSDQPISSETSPAKLRTWRRIF